MLIRRRLVSAMCLLSMGSSVVCGQQKNPFAEWDALIKQTDASVSAAATSRPRTQSSTPGGIQYFAPSSQAETKLADSALAETKLETPANTTAAPVASTDAPAAGKLPTVLDAMPEITERLKSRPSPDITTNTHNAAAATPAAETPAAAPPSSGPSDSPSAQNAGVQRADFSPSPATAPAVVQISGQQAADASNPFAELLKAAEQGAPRKPGGNAQASFEIPGSPALETPDFDTPAFSEPALTPSSVSPSPSAPRAAAADAGPQAPGVTLQWIRHGEFNVGQACELELQILNSSRTTLQGVTAEASIPDGLQVTKVSPQPTSTAGTPAWALGQMNAGEKRSITFHVVPAQRGNVQLDASVRLTGTSSAVFAVQEPLLAVTVDGPPNIEVGQQVTYTVRVNNPGTGVASNVLIQAAIPEGLEHRRGSLLTIEIGTLNPGESRQAQLIVTAVRGGSHDMAVRVIAEGGLLDQTVSTVSIEEPRLNLQITGPSEQMAGRTAQYSLQVVNEGGVPSANVRAKFRVPAGFEFVSADRGGKFNEVDHSIEWFVGTVASGTHSQFNVELKATETGAALHQAGVISEHGKVTMAEHATRVDGTAVLDLQVVASQPRMNVSDEVTYEVRISNTGSRRAENVGVSCELPSALELLDVAGPSEYIAENGVMVFKSVPQIEAGKSAVFAIRLRCHREGSHRIRLRVASQSITEALIGEETAVVTTR